MQRRVLCLACTLPRKTRRPGDPSYGEARAHKQVRGWDYWVARVLGQLHRLGKTLGTLGRQELTLHTTALPVHVRLFPCNAQIMQLNPAKSCIAVS